MGGVEPRSIPPLARPVLTPTHSNHVVSNNQLAYPTTRCSFFVLPNCYHEQTNPKKGSCPPPRPEKIKVTPRAHRPHLGAFFETQGTWEQSCACSKQIAWQMSGRKPKSRMPQMGDSMFEWGQGKGSAPRGSENQSVMTNTLQDSTRKSRKA